MTQMRPKPGSSPVRKTSHWNAIRPPSGDQAGTPRQTPPAPPRPFQQPLPGSSDASRLSPEPSPSTTKISSVSHRGPQPFGSLRWNTIRLPSGDQSGSRSLTSLAGCVIRRAAEPSGLAVKTANA
jgi:hypothetical protein